MKNNIIKTSVGMAAILALLFTGCAHSGAVSRSMEKAPADTAIGPQEGKAMVVFMRPQDAAYKYQSSVFEIKDNQPVVIGIVASGTKLPYQTEPGQHLFMVIGESADFMSANVLPNKTYYAIVTPRWGAWKPRYSLSAAGGEKLDTEEFRQWLAKSRWVEKTAASDKWAANNMASIVQKQTEYYPKWTAKPENEKPKLRPEDGR